MISLYYGRNYSLQSLRERCYLTRSGVSLLGVSQAAEKIGFKTVGVSLSFEKLANEAPLPCIVHWNQNHFVVVYSIKPLKNQNKKNIIVADPAHGIIKYSSQEFLDGWLSINSNQGDSGVALLLEPTPRFYELEGEQKDRSKLSFLYKYLKPHRKFFVQLIIGMLVGSILQLILPFLAQATVDKGIVSQNLPFITLIFVAQVFLLIGKMSVDFLRGWILLHLSTRINITLISEFLIKLMKLPLGFFDSKLIGDITQRIGDHTRIQNFLTNSSISVLFSFVNFIVFAIVLLYYNINIFLIFFTGNALYFLWIILFLGKRRELDFKRFTLSADNQSNLFQLIVGMQEIKLNNCESQRRWKWERIQANLYKVNMKGLALSQYQQLGSLFLSQSTSLLITFLAARSVVNGELTIGMMMAITYIVGQISAPVEQMIGFVQSLQDAKMSLERMGEIHKKDDEEPVNSNRRCIIDNNLDINIKNLTFRYEGPNSPLILDDISFRIPNGKLTAIVGTSGSGKSTLIKLILGFYKPDSGTILIGQNSLNDINGSYWRSMCGVVMQDGFIFSESIAENIAISDEIIDLKKLKEATSIANIQDFIEGLPLGYNTKIGQEGSGISQGQKQRLLIARSVYKNPQYIFFDEATNALDSNNERKILTNLNMFFRGKTAVVVAHRLSTVKKADQIIVLEKGKIVEQGSHDALVSKKGFYFELVKNQLELGN